MRKALHGVCVCSHFRSLCHVGAFPTLLVFLFHSRSRSGTWRDDFLHLIQTYRMNQMVHRQTEEPYTQNYEFSAGRREESHMRSGGSCLFANHNIFTCPDEGKGVSWTYGSRIRSSCRTLSHTAALYKKERRFPHKATDPDHLQSHLPPPKLPPLWKGSILRYTHTHTPHTTLNDRIMDSIYKSVYKRLDMYLTLSVMLRCISGIYVLAWCVIKKDVRFRKPYTQTWLSLNPCERRIYQRCGVCL